LSKLIVDVAEKVCEGKVVLLVGSGYNPRVLPLCWYALAAGVAGVEKIGVADPSEPPVEPPWCRERVADTVKDLRKILKKYWRCFR
jgi:acetoin utilization deacetylase AcuC-like enzyme